MELPFRWHKLIMGKVWAMSMLGKIGWESGKEPSPIFWLDNPGLGLTGLEEEKKSKFRVHGPLTFVK